MPKTFGQTSPQAILAGTFILFFGPFLMLQLFPAQLDTMMDISSYLVFHNIAEFFSIMVSLSLFSVGWNTYDQSKDQHALLLSTAFLAVGLLDFMHTLSNAAMPAFFTANSTNKSTQFWIAARLFDASAFLASAFVYPERHIRWLSRKSLMTVVVAAVGLIFIGVTFFPSYLPATAIKGVGLTPLKRILEFVVILMLLMAGVAYWKRMARTGERTLIYYLAAFIICIFSEAVFASYKTGFDTYNVLGHIYKVIAFFLIYKGIFIASVKEPYLKLVATEDRVKKLNVELEQRVAERTSQLEDANHELEAFNYSVSHDLRAPLTNIHGCSRVLLELWGDRLDGEGRNFVMNIHEEAQRMDQLIATLLNFSRLSRGEINRHPVDLSALAHAVAGQLRKCQPERRGTFVIAEGLTATADGRLLRIVVENLLGNAWKYTGKCATAVIEFGVGDFSGYPAFFIRDNGAGFHMADADKLFKAFQRLPGTTEFDGHGIGLATVQRIVQRHGGRVWGEGEPGKGATFFFTIPPDFPNQ